MSKIIDLSQPLSPRTPRSSDHPQVAFSTVRWYSRHGIKTNVITSSLHSGTHLDAPSLYFSDGLNVDEIPIERFYGPGVVIDVTRPDWGIITADELEAAKPRIEPGDIVILRTGWHHYYYDEERYVLKSPGLDKAAVDWLVKRKVGLVCGDSPSLEHIFMRLPQWQQLRPDIFGAMKGDSERFPPAYAHKTLFKNDIYMIDHVGGDLDQVLGKRCTIAAFPAKYEGVEGAPVRMVAIID
jgi:kynurenine formamidase